MANEIIYVCNSKNNKNVREGELEILEKHEDQLYFEFGENQMNIKKRFYENLETLNKDFEALLKLKNNEKEEIKEEIEEEIEEVADEEFRSMPVFKKETKESKKNIEEKNKRKYNRKNLF